MKKRNLIIVVACILFIAVFGYFYFKENGVTNYSYVILRINPEVEFAVDEEEMVREVTGLNEDADILITDLELIGKNVDEATKIVINEAEEMGLLDEDINLEVINDDEDRRLDLEEKLSESIEKHVRERAFNAEVVVNGVTDEMKVKAEEYEISNGKMLLVSRAVELNDELTEEELVTLSVKEIQTNIKETSVERREKEKIEKKLTDEELEAAREQKKIELKEKAAEKKDKKKN